MSTWKREVGIALLLCLILGFLTVFTHLFLPGLFLALAGVLSWQIYQTNRFAKWLSQGAKGKFPPKAKGIWEEIYFQVYLLKKREKRRKKKLGKIIDQFRKSTDALPDAAVVLGKYDEIEWANVTARALLGLKSTDKGQRLPNLIRFPVFVNYLNAGNFNESIVIPSPTDPEITLSVRIIHYGAGLRLLLAQNITQLKKMEIIRKDFVANVSHELRTPLTVLKGYLETLQENEEPLPPLFSYSLQQMQEQTVRMQSLVEDLLLLSKLETQPRKSQCVNIPALLDRICKENERLDPNGNRIRLTLASDTHIYGDEQELHSAFANLLNNALKYSPSDSAVDMEWREDDKHIFFSVTDRGEGIPENEIPRITERFYRVNVKRSQSVKGTGLGLAIVKHVLIRHDAELVIKSVHHKGSRFLCQFPSSRRC